MANVRAHAFSSDEVAGLVAALADRSQAVRTAAVRALSRLMLDPPVSAADERLRTTLVDGFVDPADLGRDALASADHVVPIPLSRDAARELADRLVRATRSPAVERLAVLLRDDAPPHRDAVLGAVRQLATSVAARDAGESVDVGEVFALFRLTWHEPAARQSIAWCGSRLGLVALVHGLRNVLLAGRSGDRLAAATLIEAAAGQQAAGSPPDPSAASPPAVGGGSVAPVAPLYKNGPHRASGPADEAADERPWPVTTDLQRSNGERRINVWIGDAARPMYRIDPGTSAVMHFCVGAPIASSLATGDAAEVSDNEIPAAGLSTRWTVVPRQATLSPTEGAARVAASGAAVFDLLVPYRGDSAAVALQVASAGVDASLTIVIEVGDKRWRELEIALVRTGAPSRDIAAAPLADVRLGTSHEWTTPPGELGLNVILPGLALVTGNVGGQRVNPGGMVDIVTDKALLSAPVNDLRKAVDDFRKAARWTAYLNDIDDATLRTRLATFAPQYDWSQLDDLADPAHDAAWAEASASAELHDLAFYGRRLYDTLFPPGKPGRTLLDSLAPGHRVSIVWCPGSAAGWVRIPWDLLYRGDVSPGVPVDAMSFWGLRYRIACTSYEPTGIASSRLGTPSEASCTSLLFFGESAKEPATAEAVWQRSVWQSLGAAGKPVVVPQSTGASAKQELVRALIEPERSAGPQTAPVAVLYLFCHYGNDNDGKAILRFGLNSAEPNDVIRDTELGTAAIASRPLVFANACATAGAGVYEASRLAKAFFDRGCRAYIGSECMVPVVMASRFAMVFFHFLLREVDPDREPISCGEALAQARLFLWCHYRNVGGLLYSYLNQYDLYLASPQELAALRIG